jgi:hypothetical protein
MGVTTSSTSAATYVPIQSQTLGSDTTPVNFTSIPQSYTDLVLIASIKAATGTPTATVRVGNGSVDTGNNYSLTFMYGNGSSSGSGRVANNGFGVWADLNQYVSTSSYETCKIEFLNYSNTTTYKTFLYRSGSAGLETEVGVNLWRSTAAINTIQLALTGNYAAGSTFTLYGIQAA